MLSLLAACLLCFFPNHSFGQFSEPAKQEPPQFQKPNSFRYILGVRNQSGYGRNQKGYGTAEQRSSNSRMLNVQYQEADSGFQPIGSGVRNQHPQNRKPPIIKQVDPINDPFGDLSNPNYQPTKKYTRKSNSFVVPVQNQQRETDFQSPIHRTAGNRTTAQPPRIHQESILRRPDNSPVQSRSASQRTETLGTNNVDAYSLEPRLRRALQNQVPQDRNQGGQENPMNQPIGDSPRVQEKSNDPMTEQPMTSPMDNSLRQDNDPMQDPIQDETRQKYELDCEELKGVLFQKSVQDIALKLRPNVEKGKDTPQFCDFDVFPAAQRRWCPQSFLWTASAACSKPLYFQHIQLERYGHSRGPIIQPVLSAAHFFGNVAIYPYKAGIHPYNECMYALGYYRPGDCAPWLREPWPWSIRGAASQAASAVGYSGVFR